jgi:hypothetical protein
MHANGAAQTATPLIYRKAIAVTPVHPRRNMDESHIEHMIEVMIACHGEEAEIAARKRANRCMRRRQPQWAALWREVADRIAARGTAPKNTSG